MTEMTVSVRALKTQLSRYLRQVKAGRTVHITERGRTVGRIVPPAATLHEKLEGMRRAGLIRWNGKGLKPMKPIARVSRGRSVAQLVVDDRR